MLAHVHRSVDEIAVDEEEARPLRRLLDVRRGLLAVPDVARPRLNWVLEQSAVVVMLVVLLRHMLLRAFDVGFACSAEAGHRAKPVQGEDDPL